MGPPWKLLLCAAFMSQTAGGTTDRARNLAEQKSDSPLHLNSDDQWHSYWSGALYLQLPTGSSTSQEANDEKAKAYISTVSGLLSRVVSDHADKFFLEVIEPDDGKDVFEVSVCPIVREGSAYWASCFHIRKQERRELQFFLLRV